MDQESEKIVRVRRALRKLGSGKKFLNPGSLRKNIEKVSGLNFIEISDALETLCRNGEVISQEWSRYPFRPEKRVSLNLKAEPAEPYEAEWLEILSNSNIPGAEILFPLARTLKDVNRSYKIKILNGLCRLRQDQDMLAGLPEFEISARYLIGSSKLLSNLNSKILQEFGIHTRRFETPPRYMIVAGPPNPRGVILVENPHSFEKAVGCCRDYAWIVTFGYGLNVDEYGKQLDENMTRVDKICMLVRQGTPPALDALLDHHHVHFWGDLDPEGLKIFTNLKKKIPQIELSGLYIPMLKHLKQSQAHPYVKAVAKSGQKRWESPDRQISDLLGMCQNAGVDQEILSEEDIVRFAGVIFEQVPG